MSEPAQMEDVKPYSTPAESGGSGVLSPGGLTQAQKAAVIITAVGPEAAGDILRKMSQKNLRIFAQALSELGEIPTPLLDSITDEFVDIIEEGRLFGGRREAKAMLSRFMTADAVAQLFEEDDADADGSVWTKLMSCAESMVASYLNAEHPQVCAVVLSRISTEKAARIIARMDPLLGEVVINRLSHIATPSPETLQIMSHVLETELIAKITGAESSRRPDDMISAILNHLPGEKREPLFKSLEDAKPQLAAAVQRKMFTFNDISRRIDPRQVTAVIRAVDNDLLLTALAYGRQRGSPSVEFILSNISKRLAEQYEEDLKDARSVRGREGEDAHATLITAIRTMAEKGEIDLLSDDEEEEDFL